MKLLAGLFLFSLPCGGFAKPLEYAPAPADNPLRGLVPYKGQGGEGAFPHSMEFTYFAMRDLMKGWGEFDWEPLDKALEEVAGRGKQLVFRVYLEFPGKGDEVPEFLKKEGVRVTEWHSDESDAGNMGTPDYENPVLRKAISEFIAAMGERYDGDPRVGFITAGILGNWGEWHNYPRHDLWASKGVQTEVMDAFSKGFRKTKVLLRYPAGEGNATYAANAGTPFGYHDDSFGRTTIEVGSEQDGWVFMRLMTQAKATEKWMEQPVGGEISPTLWKAEFTDEPHASAQDFRKCVEQTHVSWLMDSGLFSEKAMADEQRVARALKETSRMGYELFVSNAEIEGTELRLVIENRGVAPFYYDWPVEIRADGGSVMAERWKISGILPGEPVGWTLDLGRIPQSLEMRVRNPMAGGNSLRFANKETDGEWVVLK